MSRLAHHPVLHALQTARARLQLAARGPCMPIRSLKQYPCSMHILTHSGLPAGNAACFLAQAKSHGPSQACRCARTLTHPESQDIAPDAASWHCSGYRPGQVYSSAASTRQAGTDGYAGSTAGGRTACMSIVLSTYLQEVYRTANNVLRTHAGPFGPCKKRPGVSLCSA